MPRSGPRRFETSRQADFESKARSVVGKMHQESSRVSDPLPVVTTRCAPPPLPRTSPHISQCRSGSLADLTTGSPPGAIGRLDNGVAPWGYRPIHLQPACPRTTAGQLGGHSPAARVVSPHAACSTKWHHASSDAAARGEELTGAGVTSTMGSSGTHTPAMSPPKKPEVAPQPSTTKPKESPQQEESAGAAAEE